MTKILTQNYRMIVDEPENCHIGQMIIEGDDVIGFISRANSLTGICEVVLFQPREIEMIEGMESIEASVPDNIEIFNSVLGKASSEIQLMWLESTKEFNKNQPDE